jgi:hypothetical protein
MISRTPSIYLIHFWKTNDNLFLSYCPYNSDIQRFSQFSRPNLRGGLILQRKCFFKKNPVWHKNWIPCAQHVFFWIYHHQLRPRPRPIFWKAKNIECLELTSQKSLSIKAKNRLRSTLREGGATLVLVKIQLFSNVNLETNISFKSCQYKSTNSSNNTITVSYYKTHVLQISSFLYSPTTVKQTKEKIWYHLVIWETRKGC